MMLLARSVVARYKNNYCWLTCDSMMRIPQPHYHVRIPAVITVSSTLHGYNAHRNRRRRNRGKISENWKIADFVSRAFIQK